VSPVPDVVDSDVDKNNGGLFLQDVLVETLLAVGDLCPPMPAPITSILRSGCALAMAAELRVT
jgi:hypothetical protein